MREAIDMLKRQWELRKDELIVLAVIMAVMSLGISLFINILLTVVDGGEEIIQMSPASGAMGIGVFMVVFVGFQFSSRFNLAISCGETRKDFVIGYVVFSLIEEVLAFVFLLLVSKLELVILRGIAQDAEVIEIEKYVFQMKYFILGLLFLLAVVILCNALTLRYGKTAFWIIWAIWMICTIFGSKIITFIAHTEWIQDLLQKILSAAGTLVVGYLLVPAMLGIAWGYLRKQRVTL